MSETHISKEGKPLFWKDEYEVKSYDVDSEKRLTLMSLCNCFQESAWHHAERCDLGYKSLAAKGQHWVLSRLRIEIERLPLWQEPFTVETWSKGARGLFALRDFLVVDREQSTIVKASTGWLIVDGKKKRPQRLKEFEQIMPFLKERHAVEEPLEKLVSPHNPRVGGRVTVRFSDIDLNRHTTSSRYIEWIVNSFPYDTLSTRAPRLFEINFLAESFFGDRITVLIGSAAGDEDSYLVLLQREQDDRELCRARIDWE